MTTTEPAEPTPDDPGAPGFMSPEDERELVTQTDNSVRPEDGDQSEADNTPGEMAT